jgi:hypothetical protein
MGENKYLEKLKDPRWQKKRLEIMERDGWMCKSCGDKDSNLNVHHIFYLPKKEPWEIPNGLLITLCETCHKSGPCNAKYKSCDDCPEYQKDCDGNDNAPEDLVDCIASLLNEIWKDDPQGDFRSLIGWISAHIGEKQ